MTNYVIAAGWFFMISAAIKAFGCTLNDPEKTEFRWFAASAEFTMSVAFVIWAICLFS